MKESSIVAALAGATGILILLTTPLASARDHVNWSVNIGVPVATYPAYASVYSQPPVIYTRPAPVYFQEAPVYYGPQPVLVSPAPYYGQVYYNGYAQPYYNGYPQPYYWDQGRRFYGDRHGHGGHHYYGR